MNSEILKLGHLPRRYSGQARQKPDKKPTPGQSVDLHENLADLHEKCVNLRPLSHICRAWNRRAIRRAGRPEACRIRRSHSPTLGEAPRAKPGRTAADGWRSPAEPRTPCTRAPRGGAAREDRRGIGCGGGESQPSVPVTGPWDSSAGAARGAESTQVRSGERAGRPRPTGGGEQGTW